MRWPVLFAAAAVLTAAAACGGSTGRPAPSEAPSGSATAPAAATSIPATPDATATPAELVIQDGPLTFRVCSTVPWTRPPLAAMREVFADPRFGGPPRPAPELLSSYFAPVLRLDPATEAANATALRLGGLDFATATPAGAACPDYAEAAQLLFDRLALIDAEPVTMRRDGGRVTVTVRSAPGTARDVVYPDPPLPHEGSRGRADTLFRSQELVVIDLAGRVIAEERVGRRVGYDANGTLVFAVTDLQREPALTFTVAAKPLEVVGYTVAGRFEPGTVRLLEANGRDVPFASAGSAPAGWDEVLRATLAPGTYTVTGINKEPARGGGVLVLPASTPLP